jgi:ketosteroid isomerase-like protein
MRNAIVCLLVFSCLSFAAESKSSAESNEQQVRQTLADFIRAFDNLEWDAFRTAFADDATVFYPRGFPLRATGRAQFESNFRVVFEQIRNGRTQGPYMDLRPKDLHLQLMEDVAIATFHLDDRPGFLNRRTIVLHKTSSGWKIVHLHASEVPNSSTLAGQKR